MEDSQPPPPHDGGTAFRRAINDFKQRHLNGTESEQFQFTDLAALRSSMQEIQDEQASKSRMRNMTRVKKFVEGMEQYEKLIEVFLNASEVLPFVWGPMKFLLQITRNYVKAFDALLDHYEDMGEQLDVLAKHQALFKTKGNEHLDTVLEMIFRDVLDFHAMALSYFRQKRWRTFFDISWNTFQTRFSEPIGNLKRHRRLLENHASLTTLEMISAISNDQTEAFKLQRQEARRQQLDRVRSWLVPEDMMVDQDRHAELQRMYGGTGEWILHRNAVKAWLDFGAGVDPILWLTGIPGAGKTILASAIIEAAVKLGGAKIVFFYCKDGNQKRNNFLSIAKNLLYDLSKNDDRLTEYIDGVMSKEGQTTLQRVELAKELLRVVVGSHDNLFIVIDGLDECLKAEKKAIVSWVQSLISSESNSEALQTGQSTGDLEDEVEPTMVRCLFVSQDDSECTRFAKGHPSIKIRPGDNHDDINTFCKTWDSKIQSKHASVEFGEGPDFLTQTVMQYADGMFLFAKLVMEHLHALSKANRVREELKWLQEGSQKQGAIDKLSEAYDRILRVMKQEDDERYRDAMQILVWVAIAQRDLRWHEIQGAVSLDLEGREVDFGGRRFSDEDGPKDLCGSLVEVTQDGVVTMVHSSARHFLIKHHMSVTEEHVKFTTVCLAYLNLGHVDDSLSDETIKANIMKGRYAFFDYAVAHWLDHLADSATSVTVVDQSSLVQLSNEIRQFLNLHWQKTPNLNKSIPQSFMKRFQSFTMFGPDDFLEALAQAACTWSAHFIKRTTKQQEKSAEDDSTRRLRFEPFIPRLRASLDGAAQTLRTSTEKLCQLQQYHGPGLYKCRFVHCDYFHLGFSEKGPRDAHQNKHDCAFFCTVDGCPFGNIGFSSSRSLEDHLNSAHTADVGNDGDSAWFPNLKNPKDIDAKKAAKKGDFAAIQRWAEQFEGRIPFKSIGIYLPESMGVTVGNASGAYSMLTHIFMGNRLEILKYIIEKSQDPAIAEIASLHVSFVGRRWPEAEEYILSSPPKLVGSPGLHYALAAGLPTRNEAMALRILRRYRESTKQLKRFSPLHLMATFGFLACIRFLVKECSLDANHVDRGRTVLMEAAERGHASIVRFLVEERHCTQETIDFNKRGSGMRILKSAADLASENGHESIVHLLAANIDPSRLSDLVAVARLRQAAIDGNCEAISKILDSGAPIDIPDSDMYTPYLHAVENNRKDALKLLLDHGKMRISINRTCACHHPCLRRTRSLVENSGATSLHIACIRGFEEVVELLLACDGIDAKKTARLSGNSPTADKMRRKFGGYKEVTAFQIAVGFGFSKIAKLFEHRKDDDPSLLSQATKDPAEHLSGGGFGDWESRGTPEESFEDSE